MEEGAIKYSQEVRPTAARSEAFPSTSHPQSASSGQDINEDIFFSCQSFLTEDIEYHGSHTYLRKSGAAPQELPNTEFNSSSNLVVLKAKGRRFVNNYHKTRPNEKKTVARARSEAFTSSNPQSASSGQDINEDKLSSHRTSPIEVKDHAKPRGAAPQQIPQEIFEFGSSSNHRRLRAPKRPRPSSSNPQSAYSGQDINEDKLSSHGTVPRIMDHATRSQQESVITIDVPEPSSNETNDGKRRDVDRDLCSRLLLRAAYKGDWPAAKEVLEEYPECIRFPITKEQDAVLHNAVSAKHTTFVTELVKLMTPADLEMESIYKFTALHVAAETGVVTMAKQIVEKNDKLLLINDKRQKKPLLIAAWLGHRKMVSYLLSVTPFQELTIDEFFELLRATIYTDLYDMALEIVKKIDQNLATAENTGNGIKCWWKALEELAKKPLASSSQSQLSFWKRRSNSWIKGICIKALTHSTSAHQLFKEIWKKVGHQYFSSNFAPDDHMKLLFEAAKVGNVEFLIILARTYPDLLWQVDKNKVSLFHIAVSHRHESVFKLIYEIGNNKNSLASYTNPKTKNNMLHLAGKLAPPDRLNIISGAALQMQRELLWFTEIEKIMPPLYVNNKNSKGKTPKEIFIKTHKDLQKDGEKWMKDTANYCMLVATLIATVIFAAAFTVPGGSNQETGTPIFLRSNWFMVFFISDAIALCSSSTSIVIFLSILTSRYTVEDFLQSLPSKLVFGLATLFISMAGMMVAFSATCFLVYSSARAWAPVVVITSASIPVTLFVLVHHKLWGDIFLSTYQSRFLFRSCKRRLF